MVATSCCVCLSFRFFLIKSTFSFICESVNLGLKKVKEPTIHSSNTDTEMIADNCTPLALIFTTTSNLYMIWVFVA